MFSEQREMGQPADSYLNNLDIAWGWLQIRQVACSEVRKAARVWSAQSQPPWRLRQEDLKYNANPSNRLKLSLKQTNKTNNKAEQTQRQQSHSKKN